MDQIVASHSRDKNFKNQEFLHYYKSNGNIWLYTSWNDVRKSLTLKAAVCVFSIVGALVMIGLAYVEDIYILAVYPFTSSLIFLIKLAMDIELVSSDDKKNAKKSMSNYVKLYPYDPTAKDIKEGKTDKLHVWYMTAKKTSVQTGRLGKGGEAQEAIAKAQEGKGPKARDPQDPDSENQAEDKRNKEMHNKTLCIFFIWVSILATSQTGKNALDLALEGKVRRIPVDSSGSNTNVS